LLPEKRDRLDANIFTVLKSDEGLSKKEQFTQHTVKVFSWSSFLNDVGAEMIYPIWPFFLTVYLGANMAVLGLIDGLSEAVVSISQAASGYLSDRFHKRKVFIWLGYVCAFLSRIGYSFSSVWEHIIPFRILDRAGKIRDAPRDAILADISVRHERGRNFGILKAMDKLGGVFGIIFSILFFKLIGYRNLFLIAAIPSLIAVVLVFAFVKEKKAVHKEGYKWLSFNDMSRDFRLFLLLSGVFALGSFSYSFLLVYAQKFGFHIESIPVLYLAFTVVAFLFSIPAGKLADKIGRKPVLLISFILWAVVCWLFLFLNQHIWAVVLTFIVYGMHKGALDPVQRAFVSELSPKERRASGLGVFQMILGFCALPSSFIAGLLWDKINYFVPLIVSLALTLAAIIMLSYVKEKDMIGKNRHSENPSVEA
jgi:MFS family permease